MIGEKCTKLIIFAFLASLFRVTKMYFYYKIYELRTLLIWMLESTWFVTL